MTVVIDASLAAAGLVERDERGRWARTIIDVDDLVAPHHLPVELANALRRAAIRGDIPQMLATIAHREATLLPISLEPFAPHAARIWELRATVTPYDAWYVAVAEAFDLPLVTLDRRLAQAPGPRCQFLLPPDA